MIPETDWQSTLISYIINIFIYITILVQIEDYWVHYLDIVQKCMIPRGWIQLWWCVDLRSSSSGQHSWISKTTKWKHLCA